MPTTPGNQGVFRVIEETTPGTTPTNPNLILLAKITRSVKVMHDKDAKERSDIGDYDLDGHYSARNVYGLEVEVEVDNVSRILDFAERKSDGSPRSWTIEFIPNEDAGVSNVVYYRGTGWRGKTVTIEGKVGESWISKIVLDAGKLAAPTTTDPGIGSGSREAKAAVTAAVRHWASGAITVGGVAFGVLHEEFSVTIDHGTTAGHTTGDAEPVAAGAKYGKRKINGTATFTLDDGAKTHYDRVRNFADGVDVVIPFGSAGQPKITLSGVKFPKVEVELAHDTDTIAGSQPFEATTFAEGTV